MASFQFTPEGIVESGDESGFSGVIPANADLFRAPEKPAAKKQETALPPARPLNVVKAAKARRRELKREISRLHKLEKELAELDRLLAAAANKPRPAVRDISNNLRRA